MRVGLVIYGSLETISGGYLYDRMLVAHLRRAGHSVEVISLPWRNYLAHLGDNFSKTVRAALDGIQVDVLLQDELNHPSLIRANLRYRRLRAKTLERRRTVRVSIVHHLRCSERRPVPLTFLYRRIERAYLRSVDAFLFNSRTTKDVVSRVLGIEPAGIVAVPAGDHLKLEIDEDEIAARSAELGPLRVLFLGNLIERKGLHRLMDALAQLPPETWRLNVVGSAAVEPGYAARMFDRVRSMGWVDRVDFYGTLKDKHLVEILRRNQVLAMPSSYEGFGIACLEGMGMGLPVLASVHGGMVEIVRPEENGFLVDPKDSATLARQLAILHEDRSLLARMSLAARRTFVRHPTWEASLGPAVEYLSRLS